MKINKNKTYTLHLSIQSIALMLLMFCVSLSHAQQSSNIYLGKLSVSKGAQISELTAITSNAAYTNQPYFFSEHELYFTQSLKNGDEEQMDSIVFNLLDKTNTNLTNSPISEYSPTPLPNRNGFSVIRVNESGKQELWSYTKEGKALEHLVPAIEPVGYQVWINKHELLLFVLGEPHTLQRVDTHLPDNKGKVIDDNIGASLYRFQNSDWFLYTKQLGDSKAPILKAYNATTNKTVNVGPLIVGSEYFSVSTTGHLLTSAAKQLHHRHLIISGGKPSFVGIWDKVKIDHVGCQNGISRTAIPNFGDRIALVCTGSNN